MFLYDKKLKVHFNVVFIIYAANKGTIFLTNKSIMMITTGDH